jgi:hypothetical protein
VTPSQTIVRFTSLFNGNLGAIRWPAIAHPPQQPPLNFRVATQLYYIVED